MTSCSLTIAADIPGMPACSRNDSRYVSRTGRTLPKAKTAGCWPDGRADTIRTRAAAAARALIVRCMASPDERELAQAHEIVGPPWPDERGVARRGVGTDAHVVLGVRFERRSTEEREAREILREVVPGDLFTARRIGHLRTAVHGAGDLILPRERVVFDRRQDGGRRDRSVEPCG